MHRTNPPVACTLGPNELRAQAARWQKLVAAAGTGRAPTDTGLLLRFRRDPSVEHELRELAAVEAECCAWARWTVEADADELVLAVSSTGYGVAVIHGLFASRT